MATDGPWPDIPMGDDMGVHGNAYPPSGPIPMHGPSYQMDNRRGSSYQNDYQGQFGSPIDPFDNYDNSGNFNKSGKKTKKNKQNLYDATDYRSTVEVRYEGWRIERLQPRPGKKSSWAYCARDPMSLDQKALLATIKLHKQKYRSSPQRDLKKLSEEQQRQIERLVDWQNGNERHRDAEWILADVYPSGRKNMMGTVTYLTNIQVILKRQDRNQVVGRERTKDGSAKTYHISDVMDLNEPLYLEGPILKKGKAGKKGKKAKSLEQIYTGMGFDPPYSAQQNNNTGQNQQYPVQQDHYAQPMAPPPLQIPQYAPQPAMHSNQPLHDQYPMNPPPPPQHYPQQHHTSPQSARHEFPPNINPFQPNAEFATPGLYDSPLDERHDFPHSDQHQSARAHSTGHMRRSSARRSSGDHQRFRQLEDSVRALTDKMDNIGLDSNSSDRSYEDEVFTPMTAEGHDWSTPSSPMSQFSETMPRSRSERRRSSYRGDRRYHPRERSHRYRGSEVDVIPEYSHGPERGRYLPEPRRRSMRPKLEHARTYDDYPTGRAAEPRYLPPPEAPRPPTQRRLTNYEDAYDYDEYDDGRRIRDGLERRDSRRDSRRESRRSSTYDSPREMYEPSTRDRPRSGRRQSYAGSRGYHD